MRVALVSCLELDQADHDFEPLRAAFAARGHAAENAAWDDPAVDWGRYGELFEYDSSEGRFHLAR
jgi:hypothetical protein